MAGSYKGKPVWVSWQSAVIWILKQIHEWTRLSEQDLDYIMYGMIDMYIWKIGLAKLEENIEQKIQSSIQPIKKWLNDVMLNRS